MQYTLAALASLASLAVAAPQPAGLNFAAVAAAPQPIVTGPPAVSYNQTDVYNSTNAQVLAVAAVESSNATLTKRSPKQVATSTTPVDINASCAPQPSLYGPTPIFPWANTVQGFQTYPVYDAVSIAALAPQGYSRAFVDFDGSMTGAGYLGFYYLSSYDVKSCAAYCNSVETCLSFNVFYERDPTLNPSLDNTCPNPTAGVAIKCTLWGVPASKAAASNVGQYRNQFQVVITGSNGYNLVNPAAAALPSFSPADALAGAINNAATYLGSTYYNQAYDPSVCAAVCKTLSGCKYFNSFILTANAAQSGLYCMFHNAAVSRSAATLTGSSNAGVSYTISNSLGYALTQ